MRILLLSATQLEVKPILEFIEKKDETSYLYQDHEIEVLVSGIGMLSTTYLLSCQLVTSHYDLVLNVGICGSFKKDIELAEIVWVRKDRPIEEGAEEGKKWINLEEMGLRNSNEFPYHESSIPASFPEKWESFLPRGVNAISVNRVLGNEDSIQKMRDYANPDIVSMEGAAAYYCCQMEALDCIQLRAVSNYVEKRNKEAWKIEEALANLASATRKFLEDVKD